jgi:hypothetical protein
LKTQSDVEAVFILNGSRVDDINDILSRSGSWIEVSRVRAVSCHSHEGDFPRRGAPSGRTNRRSQIHTRGVSTSLSINLAAKQGWSGVFGGPGRILTLQHTGVDGMIRLHVEAQSIRRTWPIIAQTSPQLTMDNPIEISAQVAGDIRVPPNHHVLLVLEGQFRIQRMPRLHEVRPGLDMMMVAIHAERALEQGILPILLHQNPGPANIRPFRTGVVLQPGLTFEDPILGAIDQFGGSYGSIGRKILYRGPICNYIVVRRQG